MSHTQGKVGTPEPEISPQQAEEVVKHVHFEVLELHANLKALVSLVDASLHPLTRDTSSVPWESPTLCQWSHVARLHGSPAIELGLSLSLTMSPDRHNYSVLARGVDHSREDWEGDK